MKTLLCRFFNVGNLEKKEFGLDLLRVWAMISVLSVHFFLYNGYYKLELTDASFIVPGAFRTLFYQAVPLYVLMTGYFKRKAVFSRKYYAKLIPTVIMWLTVSFFMIAYKILYREQSFSVYIWLKSVWEFNQPTYMWYINMYLSLSVLIPILNAAYRSLDTPKKKRLLILSLMLIASYSSTVNRWKVGGVPIGVGPNYFSPIWPVVYYVIGCYISEYKPRVSKPVCALILVICCFGQSTLDYITADGGIFYAGINFEYPDIPTVLTSVMLFLLIYDIKLQSKPVKAVFACVSSLSLPLYLVSWIGDHKFFAPYANEFTDIANYPLLYLKIVPKNFALSFIIALLLDLIVKLISAPLVKLVMKKPEEVKPDELTLLRAEVTELREELERVKSNKKTARSAK